MKTKMTVATMTMLFLAGMLAMASSAQAAFVQGEIVTLPLWTWSDAINVGTVTVAIEGEDLTITLETIWQDGWLMYNAHLYLDTTWPGWSFPFPLELFWDLGEWPGGLSLVKVFIPLADLGVVCGDTLYISTHTLVINDGFQRDAWGQEDPSMIGWYKYFSVIIPCEEKPAGKSPGWWKHQFLAYYEGKGKLKVAWEDIVAWTEEINAYWGLPPPDFDGYPLPPVESLDYPSPVTPTVFTTWDSYNIFIDTDWNDMWTHLANWYNWAAGLAPYWNN